MLPLSELSPSTSSLPLLLLCGGRGSKQAWLTQVVDWLKVPEASVFFWGGVPESTDKWGFDTLLLGENLANLIPQPRPLWGGVFGACL